jgi:hypothetical protein
VRENIAEARQRESDVERQPAGHDGRATAEKGVTQYALLGAQMAEMGGADLSPPTFRRARTTMAKKKQPTTATEEIRRLDELVEHPLQRHYNDGLDEQGLKNLAADIKRN